MKTITLRSVRYIFALSLLALTAFAVVESAVGGRTAEAAPVAEGLSTCGTIDQPCALEAVAVSVKAAPAPAPAAPRLAEGLTACGTESAPCLLEAVEVRAESSTAHLAATERTVGMALRVRS
jgi:hypothetical protein